MVNGWEMIQVERGWSLFIGGAAALAGGVIVVAIGQVVARLDELVVSSKAWRSGEATALSASSSKKEDVPPQQGSSVDPPPEATPAPRRQEEAVKEPVEVDRYASGDITYVMYSDGSVEVRTREGAQRYASLSALRAEAAQISVARRSS